MKIVVKACECEEIIKKSRFISIISPCSSERDALLLLKKLHEQHPNASHIVYAYRIQSPDGLVCRFHDAGEPSGTAGKPIFQHLEGKQLINLIVVVIRYFGGIKLGAGGLTRAYGNAAKQAIDTAEIVDYIEMANVTLTLDYNQLQMLDYQGSPRFPVVNPISSVLQIILAGPERRAKYAGTVALDYKFRNSGA